MISCPYNGHVCSFSCHWLPWYPSITALSKEVRSNSALPVALLGAESTRLRAHLPTDSKFGWAIGWHWRKKDCLLHLLWTLVWRCALIKSTLADTSTERGKEWDWSWDAQCFQRNFRHLGKLDVKSLSRVMQQLDETVDMDFSTKGTASYLCPLLDLILCLMFVCHNHSN